MIRRPPRSTLFPYTTLFRSRATKDESIDAFPLEWQQVFLGGRHQRIGRGVSTLDEIDEKRTSLRDEGDVRTGRSEEHTSELQSRQYLVCRLLLEKKKKYIRR